MEALLFSLLPILGFFLLLLLVQAITKKQFCALCGAVFLTWALLLVLSLALPIDTYCPCLYDAYPLSSYTNASAGAGQFVVDFRRAVCLSPKPEVQNSC